MASSSPNSPHAVLFPYPAQGHINPIIHLAQKLCDRGLHVTVILLNYHLARIPHAHLLPHIRFVGIPDGLPPDCSRDLNARYIGPAVEHNISGPIEDVLQRLRAESPPITCVIGDCFISRLREVTNKLKIPRVIFWPQSATVFKMYYHANEITSNGYDPFEGTVKHFGPKMPMDLVTCIPGVSAIHPGYLPFETIFGIPGLQWLKNWIEEQIRNIEEPFCVIGNSFDELEFGVCKALPKFHAIGPLLPSAFLEEDIPHDTKDGTSLWKEEDCAQWLDKQPNSSVLYISFGSVTNLSIEQIQEIAFGLIASEQRFLWVIRPGSVVGLGDGTNVLEALPEEFVHQIEHRGKTINWAPQAGVLAHPAVSGFFSHCGWNSTLESISMGVPLLGWPHMLDQITNCWMIANEWKIGLELGRDEENKTNRGEVERAVRELMEGEVAEERRARVAVLRDAARKAVKGGCGSSDCRLEAFVEDLFRRAGQL